jgi:hypothetical protein
MNQWFDFLNKSVDVQIIKPGVALHAVAGNRTRHHVVTGLDYPSKHKRHRLIQARDSMRSLIPTVDSKAFPILVIDRASSDDFHSGSLSETEMSGARRRSVPNLGKVCRELLTPGSFFVADMAHVAPEEQVALASHANVLIGQHGAGLTHMIWMPSGSTILEIHPPLPDEAVDVFRLLAESLGHTYIRIPQSGVHAEVDQHLVKQALSSVSEEFLRT